MCLHTKETWTVHCAPSFCNDSLGEDCCCSLLVIVKGLRELIVRRQANMVRSPRSHPMPHIRSSPACSTSTSFNCVSGPKGTNRGDIHSEHHPCLEQSLANPKAYQGLHSQWSSVSELVNLGGSALLWETAPETNPVDLWLGHNCREFFQYDSSSDLA